MLARVTEKTFVLAQNWVVPIILVWVGASHPPRLADFFGQKEPISFSSMLLPQPSKPNKETLPFGAKAAHALGGSLRESQFQLVPLSHHPACQALAVTDTAGMS